MEVSLLIANEELEMSVSEVNSDNLISVRSGKYGENSPTPIFLDTNMVKRLRDWLSDQLCTMQINEKRSKDNG